MHRGPSALITAVDIGPVVDQLPGDIDMPKHRRRGQQGRLRHRIHQRRPRPFRLVFLGKQLRQLACIPSGHSLRHGSQPGVF